MKLDILPPQLTAQAKGQHVKYEKLKAFCETLRSDIICNDMAGGSDIGTHAKTALIAIQLLWNELDELKNGKSDGEEKKDGC